MGYEWLKSKYKDVVDGNVYWKIVNAIDKSPIFEFSKLKNEWEEFHDFPRNKNSYSGNYSFDEKDLLIERGEYFIEICEEMIKSYDKFVKKYDITSESWGYEDDLLVIEVLKDCISASEDFIKNLKKIKSQNEWKESKKSARKSFKEGLIDIKKQIQNYADTNEFDITVQTTSKNELIIAFGGTSDTDKIYNALIKELKSRGADLSTIDIKKKNDIVIGTWNLNLVNNGMFDDLIIDGTIDLIDNLNEVVDLHYVF